MTPLLTAFPQSLVVTFGGFFTAMFQEELPAAVREELDRCGLNGVPVLLSTKTDLSLSGQPHRHWIVATQSNVATVSDGDAPTVANHVPVAEVAEFRTQGAMGSGFLQAYIDEHWVDLARYQNTDAERFARVARKLEDLRTTGEIPADADAARRAFASVELPLLRVWASGTQNLFLGWDRSSEHQAFKNTLEQTVVRHAPHEQSKKGAAPLPIA